MLNSFLDGDSCQFVAQTESKLSDNNFIGLALIGHRTRNDELTILVVIDTGGIVQFGKGTYNISDNIITFLNSVGISKISYLII